MYILIDVEWVQEDGNSRITQIAVNRVSESWNYMAGYLCLVCPENTEKTDWSHMAYNGHFPKAFLAGKSEEECLKELAAFLQKDETIFCWHKGTKKLLGEKYERYLGEKLPNQIITVNNSVYALAAAKGIQIYGMYEVAEALGLDLPSPKHCSTNDVMVLRSLLSKIEFVPQCKIVSSQVLQKKIPTKRERNLDIISRTEYRYLYTPNSPVFHRRTCRLMLNANNIQGCLYYENAIRKRRPCKVCHPEPVPGSELPRSVPAPKQPGLTQSPDVISSEEPVRQVDKQIVVAKLLGDKRVVISKNKIVGCCHNAIHPGKMTRQLLLEHDCIGKQCTFFEKYPDSGFWIDVENKQREKQKRKKAQRIKKEAEQELQESMDSLKKTFQSYIDSAGYSMLIVSIQKMQKNRYRVFYVSENPFADGNRFPQFLQAIQKSQPHCQVQLRHVRDLDGYYVTIDEYRNRKGRKW